MDSCMCGHCQQYSVGATAEDYDEDDEDDD